MKLYPERANKAYDRMKEPWRFLLAMIFISPAFFSSSLPVLWQAAALFWCGLIGFLRAAYLCKLEFIPRGHRS